MQQQSPAASEDEEQSAHYQRLGGAETVEVDTYRVYGQRWFILFVVCVLNISNAMLWLMFSPIADEVAVFYEIDADQINWLSVVFMVATVPIGLIATGVIDTYGLRFGILLGAWLNMLGAAGRALGSIDVVPQNYRFPVTLVSTVVAACGQPFIMFLPTKTAAYWFSENQRAVANTIGSMSNPLGIMLANVVSPLVVSKPSDMTIVNIVFMCPAAVGAVLATFGVRRSAPPTPPSKSADELSEPFLQGLKQIIRNRPFWVLFICLGNGVALFSTLSTLLEQILCARGYSDIFAGVCGGLLIVSGIVGAGVAGAVVDATKRFEEVAKTCLGVATLAGIGLAQLARKRGQEVAIGCCAAAFGFFGFAVYPIGLELGVEATYPTAEATSSGLLIISGQIQGIIFVLLMQALTQPLPSYDLQFETCTVDTGQPQNSSVIVSTTASPGQVAPLDMTAPLMFFSTAASVSAVFFILCFHTPYRRLKAERAEATDRILKYPTNHCHDE